MAFIARLKVQIGVRQKSGLGCLILIGLPNIEGKIKRFIPRVVIEKMQKKAT